jgi:hypothetical protein
MPLFRPAAPVVAAPADAHRELANAEAALRDALRVYNAAKVGIGEANRTVLPDTLPAFIRAQIEAAGYQTPVRRLTPERVRARKSSAFRPFNQRRRELHAERRLVDAARAALGILSGVRWRAGLGGAAAPKLASEVGGGAGGAEGEWRRRIRTTINRASRFGASMSDKDLAAEEPRQIAVVRARKYVYRPFRNEVELTGVGAHGMRGILVSAIATIAMVSGAHAACPGNFLTGTEDSGIFQTEWDLRAGSFIAHASNGTMKSGNIIATCDGDALHADQTETNDLDNCSYDGKIKGQHVQGIYTCPKMPGVQQWSGVISTR